VSYYDYQVLKVFIVCINRYSIDRQTDADRQFAIDGNGLVTTAKQLDREALATHRVHILATDKGWDYLYYI